MYSITYMESPSKTFNISPVLFIENYGNTIYHCNYKQFKIEYNEIQMNETRAHSIYENFNKIKYELFKFWFYNHTDLKEKHKIEMSLDLIDYLKDKDFFDMTHLDKVLLTILYYELITLKKTSI